MIDPATGVAKNPTISRNQYVLPYLALHQELWEESDWTEEEVKKRREEAVAQSKALADKVALFSSGLDLAKHLLLVIQTPRGEIKKRFKAAKLDFEKVGAEKSVHKRLKAIRILREIQAEEIQKEVTERQRAERVERAPLNQMVAPDGDMSIPTVAMVGSAKFEHRRVMVNHERISMGKFPWAMKMTWKNSWTRMKDQKPEEWAQKIHLLSTVRRRHNATLCAPLMKKEKLDGDQMCQFLRMTHQGWLTK